MTCHVTNGAANRVVPVALSKNLLAFGESPTPPEKVNANRGEKDNSTAGPRVHWKLTQPLVVSRLDGKVKIARDVRR